MTLRLGILGWPLEKTYSPHIHVLLGKMTNIDLSYEKIIFENITPDLIKKLNSEFNGYNITIPHKEKVFSIIKKLEDYEIDNIVKNSNVINTIYNYKNKIYGFNTDAEGIVETFHSVNYDITNKEVLILGNGATSKTINYVLGVNNNITVASRTKSNETIMYSEINKLASNFNVLINTTPIGMPPYEDKKLDLPYDNFTNLELFFNLGYKLKNSMFNLFKNNILYIDGMEMLMSQAIASFNIWTGKQLKFDEIKKELIERLDNEN